MYRIIKKERLNRETCLLEIEAGDIAASAGAGQFVILRVDEEGERFPLTLFEWDDVKGTISVVCQAVGVSTKKLCALEEGETVSDIAGPLGNETDSGRVGKVICVGGGVGTAEAYPVAKALKHEGNDVTLVIGARSKDLIICEKQIRADFEKLYTTTDDGSSGREGSVVDVLSDLLEKDAYGLVFAIGPVPMMKAVADLTAGRSIRTIVSLNSIMIDGTGMCGVCRLIYDGESKFACVDGPEFNAHLVDFDDLMKRQARYRDKEKHALDRYCRLEKGKKDGSKA